MGTSGGVFGLERGYCLMIGGDDDGRRAPRPVLQHAGPGRRRRAAHARARGRPDARRAGLPALRPGRRRALREDGPQRDRVRDDGRLRRGAEHPRARQRRRRAAGARRRDDAAARPRGLPVRPRRSPRSPRSGGAAASSPRGCSTSRRRRWRRTRSSRASPAASRTPARAAGRCWRRSTRACPRRCSPRALFDALRVARRGRVRQPRPVGDALRLRRAPGEERHVVSRAAGSMGM